MTVMWKPTKSHTVIPASPMVEGEVVSFTFNTVHEMGIGQTPVNPTVELIDMATRETVMIDEDTPAATLDDPAISETSKINVRVTGVQYGRTYELRIGFEHSPPRVEGERTIRLHVIEGV